MLSRSHTGLVARALRLMLSAALIVQCAAFRAPATNWKQPEAESSAVATIPAAAAPAGLRIAGRQRTGMDVPHFQSGASLIHGVRIPGALIPSGILRPARVSVPSSAAFPRRAGRSPPATSV